MSNNNPQYQQNLYLSPDQQDLLLAALTSNNSESKSGNSNTYPAPTQNAKSASGRASSSPHQYSSQNRMTGGALYDSPTQQTPGSGQLGFGSDESPFLDYDIDADADGNYDFDLPDGEQMIGDLPGGSVLGEDDLHEKRKSVDGKTDDDEGGGKRRESDDKSAKKPGRKPLTSEPTSKRKAQNRAAQRAFRERKEKHLKDLETKVEDLEKASESANHENGLLRAQVDRLQVELKEYRKRLSWVGNGVGGRPSPVGANAGASTRNGSGPTNTDFQFEFPKFGDLPGAHIFNNGSFTKVQDNNRNKSVFNGTATGYKVPGVVNRSSLSSTSPTQPPRYGSTDNSPTANANSSTSPVSNGLAKNTHNASIDSLSGLFSPSIIEASRNAPFDYVSHPGSSASLNQTSRANIENLNKSTVQPQQYGSSVSNTDSPSSSSESQHGPSSSIGTSPEPSLNSPSTKLNEFGLNTINEEHSDQNTFGGEDTFCEKLRTACGNSKNPVPLAMSMSNGNVQPLGPTKTSGSEINGIDWLAQQNGGQFDPVLFGDYRESQDAVISQDFGSFFNDAFPLPDLGSPFHNFNEVAPSPAPRSNLMKAIEDRQNGEDEEVVPGEDRSSMMTCNKIWDRLQSMEKFRNGEIDVDNLCSELRTKARCSESGVVVNQRDVDDLLRRAN